MSLLKQIGTGKILQNIHLLRQEVALWRVALCQFSAGDFVTCRLVLILGLYRGEGGRCAGHRASFRRRRQIG